MPRVAAELTSTWDRLGRGNMAARLVRRLVRIFSYFSMATYLS